MTLRKMNIPILQKLHIPMWHSRAKKANTRFCQQLKLKFVPHTNEGIVRLGILLILVSYIIQGLSGNIQWVRSTTQIGSHIIYMIIWEFQPVQKEGHLLFGFISQWS